MHPVALGHHPAPAGEHLLNGFQQFLVQHQLDACQPGEHLAGQIVLSRPKTAGDENQACTRRGDAKGLDVVVEIVGDGGMPTHGDADFGQPLAQPLGVGIQVLPAGEFAADRDDFSFHKASGLCGVSNRPRMGPRNVATGGAKRNPWTFTFIIPPR